MDHHYEHEKEGHERRNSNTEYVPTKCRITRPPPPKPASNPLQFVKVGPLPLFKKAHEQIKKVEEIKKERTKEIRDETEDWQQNLDNWKSCRRKRQEHIIERVVEVKKLTEQEELEKSRRKSKTFSEMLEERSQKGRPKVTIPIFTHDDSNDLSDYGIGSSTYKTDSNKDADTDDSSGILDEKDNQKVNLASAKDTFSSNESQNEDELPNKHLDLSSYNNNHNNNNNSPIPKTKPVILKKSHSIDLDNRFNQNNFNKNNTKQYTYEGAIQDYRSRIQTKINVDESIFTKKEINKSKESSEAQTVLPKGEISKRKGLFESSKSVEITSMSKNVLEDFANARSLKDRLKSLESVTDQSLSKIDKSEIHVSVKERLANFNKQDKAEKVTEKPEAAKISTYLLDKTNNTVFENKSEWNTRERCSSPETELYMNKLSMFNRDLSSLMGNKSLDHNFGNYCTSNCNYPPSTSSVELAGVLSDREDSGIHTADVSCSVSQADEPIDTDNEAILNTIPNCIEKLKEENLHSQIISEEPLVENRDSVIKPKHEVEEEKTGFTREEIVIFTKDFLEALIKDATEQIAAIQALKLEEQNKKQKELEEKCLVEIASERTINQTENESVHVPVALKPVNYENINFTPISNSNIPVDFIAGDFTLSPPPKMEPPKTRPPPPPPLDESIPPPRPVRRLNSTKRIKKEIHSKRSSFLGLDDTDIDLLDPDQIIEKPPDITTFLQKEQKLEKSLYRNIQEQSRIGLLSKVESQDSGLDIDRGRLSSDTWCSSVPSHERQDSEQTNSILSEEDEMTKKEREIIEMVEKEEKSKDKVEYVTICKTHLKSPQNEANFEPTLGSEKFKSPYFPEDPPHYLDDRDTEVLKVERELQQLEQEELKRQRDNIIFQESRNSARLAGNRHSLENICDDIYPIYANTDYRKSLPDLQHLPLDYRRSIGDVPSGYYKNTDQIRYGQSTPNIQHAFQTSMPEQRNFFSSNNLVGISHRKPIPELQHDARRSAFISPLPNDRRLIKPSVKPIRSISNLKPMVFTKPSLKALSAIPRNRHSDNWITPKPSIEANQKWVYQEADLQRLKQQKVESGHDWQGKQDKPLPDSVIQTITQRVQYRNSLNERNQHVRRNEQDLNKDYSHHPIYVNHPKAVTHAMSSVPFSPPLIEENLQDRMLSVSGKKKCSYCSSELGRGAAMIIESLCLFYHMECFKCCVCHIQLGDGRIGTDVRVRNQKLHCHNCYSSDDGVKFSCV
ncbi:unnamed protein product [Ceutorhynchus assimilis]|uniref:LIM zinc-binding domain-containing protein n=1 Tax=Ceutorhynchus assimilis TaxID=467358 RepID=A0A9N9MAF7_9CUCU|nr:unnamed protein product [Ceutorhynchus assimilis]